MSFRFLLFFCTCRTSCPMGEALQSRGPPPCTSNLRPLWSVVCCDRTAKARLMTLGISPAYLVRSMVARVSFAKLQPEVMASYLKPDMDQEKSPPGGRKPSTRIGPNSRAIRRKGTHPPLRGVLGPLEEGKPVLIQPARSTKFLSAQGSPFTGMLLT